MFYYIKKWGPELQDLGSLYIHSPQKTPLEILNKAGMQLGTTYPFPIIEHGFSRKRALEGLAYLKGKMREPIQS